MKIFIDSNVWLRFILADIKESYQTCASLLQLGEEGRFKPYTSTVVLLEIYFVLTSTYKIKRESVLKDIDDILSARNLTLMETTDFKEAFELHKKTGIKLADCLIAKQADGLLLCSFDKGFKKIKGLNLKTPKEILEQLEIKKLRN